MTYTREQLQELRSALTPAGAATIGGVIDTARAYLDRAEKAEEERDAALTVQGEKIQEGITVRWMRAEALCAELEAALRGLLAVPIGPCTPADAMIALECNRPLYVAARAALAGDGSLAAEVLKRTDEYCCAAREADINRCASDSAGTDSYEDGARKALLETWHHWRAARKEQA